MKQHFRGLRCRGCAGARAHVQPGAEHERRQRRQQEGQRGRRGGGRAAAPGGPLQREVLEGVRITFSRIIPQGDPAPNFHHIWRLAEQVIAFLHLHQGETLLGRGASALGCRSTHLKRPLCFSFGLCS